MDINKIMQQAKQMQEKMQDMQKQLADFKVMGESGGGLVKIEISGRYDAKKTTLDSDFFDEDKDVCEDLITAAVNNALRKVESSLQEQMKDLSKSFGIPEDFKLPDDESGKSGTK